MGRLDNKVAVVTGGGSGIARATAILFAKEGAKVVIAEVSTDGSGEGTVNMIKRAGGEGLYVHTDVSKPADAKRMIDEAVKTYGKLNILANVAGIAPVAPLLEYTESEFDRIFAVNVKGIWLGMKYAIPEMIKAGGGSIVNFSSIDSDAGHLNLSLYGASKGAVNTISMGAAIEHGCNNIRVNVVKPGPITTPLSKKVAPDMVKHWSEMTPLGKWGTPEEVARLVLFFASDESSHITGQKIAIDGGLEANGLLNV